MKGLGEAGRGDRPAADFTLRQLTLSGGIVLVAFTGLLAAGLAFGLALAGAACLGGLLFAAWFIVANLVHGERPVRVRRRT